jgi:hypothetical protein
MGKDQDGDGVGDTYLPYNSGEDIDNGGDNMPLTSVSVEEPESYKPSETELLKGYIQELDIDDEIEFYLEWEPNYLTMLDFNDEEDNESITIKIISTFSQTFDIDLNEKKEVDVDDDSIKDISVKFIGFSSGDLPRINLTLLTQPTTQPPANQTTQTNQTTTPTTPTTTTPTYDYDTDFDYGEPETTNEDYGVEEEFEEPSEGGGFLTIILLVLLFGGAAFAAWFFLIRKKPGAGQPQPGQPRPGMPQQPGMPGRPVQPGFRQPMPRRPGPPIRPGAQPQPGQPRPQ